MLLRAVEEANRRVLEAAHSDPSLEGMGTTLVAALELDERLSIASVGDSRAYLLDGDGLRAITDDQTWVNEVGRPLGLDEESLRNHPMRHVLTMAIGASAPLTVNYYSVPLDQGQPGADLQRRACTAWWKRRRWKQILTAAGQRRHARRKLPPADRGGQSRPAVPTT